MLGNLAKWLRVMGCDAHYQPFYKEGVIDCLVHEGRLLLSKNRRVVEMYNPSLFIASEKVQTQLHEILKKGYFSFDKSQWFTRCLVCNIQLKTIPLQEAKTRIPEYIYYQNNAEIHVCTSCGRYFWPGSHKTRMINQILDWKLF